MSGGRRFVGLGLPASTTSFSCKHRLTIQLFFIFLFLSSSIVHVAVCLAQAIAAAAAVTAATTTELTCMQHPPPLTALHKAHENTYADARANERERAADTFIVVVAALVC